MKAVPLFGAKDMRLGPREQHKGPEKKTYLIVLMIVSELPRL